MYQNLKKFLQSSYIKLFFRIFKRTWKVWCWQTKRCVKHSAIFLVTVVANKIQFFPKNSKKCNTCSCYSNLLQHSLSRARSVVRTLTHRATRTATKSGDHGQNSARGQERQDLQNNAFGVTRPREVCPFQSISTSISLIYSFFKPRWLFH